MSYSPFLQRCTKKWIRRGGSLRGSPIVSAAYHRRGRIIKDEKQSIGWDQNWVSPKERRTPSPETGGGRENKWLSDAYRVHLSLFRASFRRLKKIHLRHQVTVFHQVFERDISLCCLVQANQRNRFERNEKRMIISAEKGAKGFHLLSSCPWLVCIQLFRAEM